MAMLQLVLKAVISGLLVVGASELAKRSSVWAAVLVSLPLTSVLALTWLWLDTHSVDEVADLSWAILWIVLPSVVLFIALPILLRAGVAFAPAMLAACVVTALAYVGYARLLERFGVGS